MSSQNTPGTSNERPSAGRKAVHFIVMAIAALAIALAVLIIVSVFRAEAREEPHYFEDHLQACEVKNAWWSSGLIVQMGGDKEIFYVPGDVAKNVDVTVGEVYYVSSTFDGNFMSFLLSLGDVSLVVADIEQQLPTSAVGAAMLESYGTCR